MSATTTSRVPEFDAFKNFKHFTLLDLLTNEQEHIRSTIGSNANLWYFAISNSNVGVSVVSLSLAQQLT
ncbi:hypothetical protein AWZ03_005098 [Drosophila navojoa]|uniref:Uncharacterized protein n=1 Tax=Drosophila navojoa TaxID=7232 RepID=A0A484BIQ4_DRONA|nr:hypothetical protein AWZ03_005098 [Drosophila navojoa]